MSRIIVSAPTDTTVDVDGSPRALIAVSVAPRNPEGYPQGATWLLVRNAAGTGVEWVPNP